MLATSSSMASRGYDNICKNDPKDILPNPRFVSFKVLQTTNHPSTLDVKVTHLLAQFGQYVCHDISLFPEQETDLNCCDRPEQDGCFPIQVSHYRKRSDTIVRIDQIPCDDPHFLKDEFKPRKNRRRFRRGADESTQTDDEKDAEEVRKVLEIRKKASLRAVPRVYFDNDTAITSNRFGLDVVPSVQNWSSRRHFPRLPEDRGLMDSGYCLEFSRSIPFCEERAVKRDQLNGNTAFLDLSNVYGNEFGVFRSLRQFEGGRLKASRGGRALPVQEGRSVSGDPRAAEMPSLAALHTLFLREHNRLAGELRRVCCRGEDDFIFQRARRIAVAEFQHLTYAHFLPKLFGPEVLAQYRLSADERSVYNPSVNPTIRNAFSTAAMRFGHSMVWDNVSLVNAAGRHMREYRIKDTYFDDDLPTSHDGRGVDYVLNGMARQPAGAFDSAVVADVTHFLFVNNTGVTGADLIARNIQRGRDHGLPAYNEYRRYCGLRPACDWSQKPEEIPADAWSNLMEVYDRAADVDLYVGGILEAPSPPSSALGPTFTCLIAKQFYNLKFGDRFFYSHGTGPGVVFPLSDAQLANVRQRTLRDVVCDNSELSAFPKDPFLLSSPVTSCRERSPILVDLFSDAYENRMLAAAVKRH